jgi:hypothetical protein
MTSIQFQKSNRMFEQPLSFNFKWEVKMEEAIWKSCVTGQKYEVKLRNIFWLEQFEIIQCYDYALFISI